MNTGDPFQDWKKGIPAPSYRLNHTDNWPATPPRKMPPAGEPPPTWNTETWITEPTTPQDSGGTVDKPVPQAYLRDTRVSRETGIGSLAAALGHLAYIYARCAWLRGIIRGGTHAAGHGCGLRDLRVQYVLPHLRRVIKA